MKKVNSVKCLECNTILTSLHVHDFRGCGCPNGTYTDGGLDYQRVGGKDFSKIERWNYETKNWESFPIIEEEIVYPSPKNKIEIMHDSIDDIIDIKYRPCNISYYDKNGNKIIVILSENGIFIEGIENKIRVIRNSLYQIVIKV